MKTASIVIALGALCYQALASPYAAPNGLRMARDVPSAGALTFVGPAEVGGPDVTLTGTAQSIHEQLLAINPSYDATAFPEYAERMAARNATSLDRRDRPAGLECNPGGSPVKNFLAQCVQGTDYLSKLNGFCRAEKRSCARVSCSKSCGIFMCNDTDGPNDVWCGNLAGDAGDIYMYCGKNAGGLVVQVKGQVFREQDGVAWNTVVKEDTNNCA